MQTTLPLLQTATSTHRLIAAVLALLCLPGLAAAGTMTFVDLWSGHTNYVENGLRVTSNAAMYLYQGGGVQAMFPSTDWQTLTLTTESGDPFTIASIDILEGAAVIPHQIVFEGTYVGGGTVSVTITTDSTAGWETVVFPESFANLVSLTWDHADYGAYVYYDNIVATLDTVPTESSTWGGVKAGYSGR